MFFCEECRIKGRYPEAVCFSIGPCELCGTIAKCHDYPSDYIYHMTKKEFEEHEKILDENNLRIYKGEL